MLQVAQMMMFLRDTKKWWTVTVMFIVAPCHWCFLLILLSWWLSVFYGIICIGKILISKMQSVFSIWVFSEVAVCWALCTLIVVDNRQTMQLCHTFCLTGVTFKMTALRRGRLGWASLMGVMFTLLFRAGADKIPVTTAEPFDLGMNAPCPTKD